MCGDGDLEFPSDSDSDLILTGGFDSWLGRHTGEQTPID